MSFMNRLAVALTAVVAATTATSVGAQNVKIGIVTFISGSGGGAVRRAGEERRRLVIDEAERRARCPRPTTKKGFGGATIEVVMRRRGRQHHEAGHRVPQPGAAPQRRSRDRLHLERQLPRGGAGRRGAEEAHRSSSTAARRASSRTRAYKYVFRTSAHGHHGQRRRRALRDGAGRTSKSIAGINQNYAWGQDSWNDFEAAMKVLRPGVEVKTSQMPKLFAGQYGAEISALLGAKRRRHPLQLLGRRPRGASMLQAGRAALLEEHLTILHRRRDRDPQARRADSRRHHHRRARAARRRTRRTTSSTSGSRRPTRTGYQRAAELRRPTRWRRRSSA